MLVYSYIYYGCVGTFSSLCIIYCIYIVLIIMLLFARIEISVNTTKYIHVKQYIMKQKTRSYNIHASSKHNMQHKLMIDTLTGQHMNMMHTAIYKSSSLKYSNSNKSGSVRAEVSMSTAVESLNSWTALSNCKYFPYRSSTRYPFNVATGAVWETMLYRYKV